MFAQPRRHEWTQPGQPAGQCVAGRNHSLHVVQFTV